MISWLKRSLSAAAVAAALAIPGLAQTAVVTITWEVEVTGPNHDCTTTLYDDGTITTEVDWAPDPDDVEIPDGVIPPGMTPVTEDIPGAMTEEQAKGVLGYKIARALIAAWIEYGLEQLEEWFDDLMEDLEAAGEEFADWLDGLFGGDAPQPPKFEALQDLLEGLGELHEAATQDPDVLDDGFNAEVAKILLQEMKDYYDTL